MFRVEDRGRVRWLMFDNPGRKSAVSTTGWAELTTEVAAFAASEQRVLVLAGAGEDFCSGADVAVGRSPDEVAGVMRSAIETPATLFELTRPTVAAVDGVAAAGGFNLALACDLIIAVRSDRLFHTCAGLRRRGSSMSHPPKGWAPQGSSAPTPQPSMV